MSFSKNFIKALSIAIISLFFVCEAGYVFYSAEPAYAAKKKSTKKKTKKKAQKVSTNQSFANISTQSIGSTFTFGKYEQDNNKTNGKEDIEWIVLAKENNRILVISKYVLDVQPFDRNGDGDWADSSLRRWLNSTFMKTAFNASEQAKIPTVKLESWITNIASGESWRGKSSQDKIFLLSDKEVRKYFASDSARQCKPTVYVKADGIPINDDGFSFWWLRDLAVRDDGYVDYSYFDVHDYASYFKGSDGVRPAMWVNVQ